MAELSFIPSSRRSWHTLRDGAYIVHVTGWAAAGDAILSHESLGRYIIDRVKAAASFPDVMGELNGNFAAIVGGPGLVHLGVDLVRSIPLFYRVSRAGVMVSDDIRTLRQEGDAIDQDSAIEYATAGFVTGPHTIFQEVTGLQAGESVSWEPGRAGPKSRRYYQYICSFDEGSSVEDLCEALDEVFVGAFKRFIESLNGRQVALALSAGVDSRVVASMLKRLGYDNVLCYCYGVPGNRQLPRSRMVAETLGYRWIHTPYSRDMWIETLRSAEMREYWGFSSNGVSFPHYDDWPAVRMLRERREVSDDAVFVTGSTGDFISGKHLKYLFDPRYHHDPSDFDGAMIKKHYSMWDDLVTATVVREAIYGRIGEALHGFQRETEEELARMYEYWEWQERQAKHIVNAVRIYEFFGYSWGIPLWDRALVDFWKPIPMPLKFDQYLYLKYVSTYDPMGLFQDAAPAGSWSRDRVAEQMTRSRRRHIYEALRRVRPLKPLLNRYIKYRKHLHEYQSHPLGEALAYGKLRYLLMDPSKRHAQALNLNEFLRYQYGMEPAQVVAAAANHPGRVIKQTA